MSFDIYAVVRSDRWPTFSQLNEAMAVRKYPARLEGFSSPTDLVKPVPSIDMRFGLTPEQIEQFGDLNTGALVRIGEIIAEPDFGYDPLEDDTLERLRNRLAQIDVPLSILRNGDILVAHSAHSDAATWNAGVYLLCSLILDFDGYGFEFQGGAHGRASFAAELFDSLDLNETDAKNQ